MQQKFTAIFADAEHEVVVEQLEGGRFCASIDGRAQEIDVRALGPGSYSLLAGARSWLADVDGEVPQLSVQVGDAAGQVRLLDARQQLRARATAQSNRAAAGPQAVRAPMPGKVVKLLVAQGARVAAGQGLVVVEAMKMENEMRAPRAGVVAALSVREGQPVDAGEVLATLD